MAQRRYYPQMRSSPWISALHVQRAACWSPENCELSPRKGRSGSTLRIWLSLLRFQRPWMFIAVNYHMENGWGFFGQWCTLRGFSISTWSFEYGEISRSLLFRSRIWALFVNFSKPFCKGDHLTITDHKIERGLVHWRLWTSLSSMSCRLYPPIVGGCSI